MSEPHRTTYLSLAEAKTRWPDMTPKFYGINNMIAVYPEMIDRNGTWIPVYPSWLECSGYELIYDLVLDSVRNYK